MSATTLKPKERPSRWAEEAMHERIENCRFMLRVHGFLSDAESERVSKRIDSWLITHGMRRVAR